MAELNRVTVTEDEFFEILKILGNYDIVNSCKCRSYYDSKTKRRMVEIIQFNYGER